MWIGKHLSLAYVKRGILAAMLSALLFILYCGLFDFVLVYYGFVRSCHILVMSSFTLTTAIC